MTTPTKLPSITERRRRKPNREPEPGRQDYVPHQLPPHWIHEHFQQTVEHRLSRLGMELMHRRQLPNEFFRKFLLEEGVSQKKASYCNVRGWVSVSGKVLLADEQKRLLALLVLLKVNFQLLGQPTEETHREALKRLGESLQALLRRKIPKTTISQKLAVNVKTVDRILSETDSHATRQINPWQLLDLVQATDWQPRKRGNTVEAEPENLSVTDDEVARSRAKDRAAQRAGWLNPRNLPKLTPEGKCHHCGAGGAHLYQVKDLALSPDLVEYQCRSCGRSSYATMRGRKP